MKNYFSNMTQRVKSNDFWAKLFKNVSTIVVGQGGASLFNMMTTFLVIGMMGAGEYGILVIGQTYMQLIDLLVNFQSWQGVIKYGSKSIVEEDDSELAAIIKSAFCVDAVSALAGAALSLSLVNAVGSLMGYDPSIILVCVLFSLEIVFHIEGTPVGILRLFDKFNYVAIHAVILAFVKLAACAISLFWFGGGIVTVALAYIATDIVKYISLFVVALLVLQKKLGVRTVISSNLRKLPRGFISFTVWTNLAEACDAPIQYFDIFFLSLLSTEVVGVFKFFKQILSVTGLLSRPVQQAIMPQLSELIAKGDGVGAYRAVVKIRKAVFKLFLPIVLILSPLVPAALGYFMDSVYFDYWYLFLSLSVLALVGVSYSALHPCFAAYGYARASLVITAVANASYCMVAFILLPLVGVMGIPIAMALQYFLAIAFKIAFIRKSIPGVHGSRPQ